jgi:hypothetical protein
MSSEAVRIDRCFKYEVPYPVALPYWRRFGTRPGTGMRLASNLLLAEAVVRFLLFANLADAMRRDPPRPKLGSWLDTLEKQSLGKSMTTLKRVLNDLTELDGGPFLAESAALVPRGDPDDLSLATPWEAALNRVGEARNRFAHDTLAITDLEAADWLSRVEPDMGIVLTGVAFLARYQLGFVEALSHDDERETWVNHWVPCRGGFERSAPREVCTSAGLPPKALLLVHPSSARALPFAPFAVLDVLSAEDGGDGCEHLFMLRSLASANKSARTRAARYARPEGGCELVRERATMPRAPEGRRQPSIALGIDADSFDPPPVDGRLCGFEVIGKLGEGGMGSVWEVMDGEDGPFALKIMKEDIAREREARERFKREVQALMGLKDPRIPRVRGFDERYNDRKRTLPYLLMDLVYGQALEDRLAVAGPMKLDDAIPIVLELLDVLSKVHERGIVHRDVHPGNIILSLEGVTPRTVHLVDFGLVAQKDVSRFTRGERLGRQGYAPADVEPEPTAKTDIFGVGQVLFAILTGKQPSGERRRLEKVAPEVPRAIGDIHARATAPLGGRYATCAAMIEGLKAAWAPDPARPELVTQRSEETASRAEPAPVPRTLPSAQIKSGPRAVAPSKQAAAREGEAPKRDELFEELMAGWAPDRARPGQTAPKQVQTPAPRESEAPHRDLFDGQTYLVNYVRDEAPLPLDPHAHPYRDLYKLALEAHDNDRAWCMCAALAFMRKADEEEQRFFEAHRPRGMIQVKSRVDNEHWITNLFHRDEDILIGKIFEMVTPAAIVAKTQALAKAKQLPVLDRRDKQDPATSTFTFAKTFGWAATVLGTRPPELYVRDDVPGALLALPARPPASVASKNLLQAYPPQELAFIIGKHLAYYRGEHYLRLLFPSLGELTVVMFAAIKTIRADFAVPPEMAQTVNAAASELVKYVQPIEREALRLVVLKFLEDGAKADLPRWMRTVDATAARAGLLLCADLEIAKKLISVESPLPGALSAPERLRELLLFSVSDQYLALRKALGIAIG